MKTSINFIPYKGYVVVALPKGFSDTTLEVHDSVLEKKREEYIQKGNELVIAAIGDGVDFASLGDKILVAGHARLQKVTVADSTEPFYVLRESDILGKLD